MTAARRPLPSFLTVGLAAASLALPSAALAKGGDKTPTPPRAAAPAVCDFTLDGPTPAGTVFSNQVRDAGCVRVLVASLGGTPALTVVGVTTTQGWTATVSASSDGAASCVKVTFSNATTGARAEAKIAPGKTVIK